MTYSSIGRHRLVTAEHCEEILEWHRQKKKLGTIEQLAQRLGYATSTVYNVIRRDGVFKVAPPQKEEEA